MSWFANIVYVIAAVIYLPFLAYQMIFQGKNRRGWNEKLFGPRLAMADGDIRKPIWVHGVSLGEVNAARQLIEGLEKQFPDRQVVISTTTDTGYGRACGLYGSDRVFRYPLDFSWTVDRAFRRVDPAMIVLVELEVWFNLVTMAARRGIPICVVNGRLTERSQRRFSQLGFLARRMFQSLSWVGAQDEQIAARFESLGVAPDRIAVTGSMKWDTATVADHIDGQDELATAMDIDPSRPLWVCGSTGVGEEALLLDAYSRLLADRPTLQLAVVPRKPERFDEVDALIRRRGFACLRRSRAPDGASPAPRQDGPTVLLGDTMGELRKLYALATVVFVGRSLVPMGGSDPMEVAALRKPVLVGPYVDNFAEPTRTLEKAGGLCRVTEVKELCAAVDDLIGDPSLRQQMGQAARQTVRENQGATQHTIEALGRFLAV